jgi:hypothetical protein
MALTRTGWVRLLWVVDTLILLAAISPNLLGHPYPEPFRPYIAYGGTLLYVIGGFCLLAVSVKLQGPSAK